ncbi:lipoprotein [Microtetraspora sp. NBRC 13810]|nr:lipoprotein [Microtetraspora sp. NBRC 13810]
MLAGAAVIVTLTAAAPQSGTRTRPMQNPDGTRPGLAPTVDHEDRSAAFGLIWNVRLGERATKEGYLRGRYGPEWSDHAPGVPLSGNGCNTRDDVLARDGESVEYEDESRCAVASMRLVDAYTGELIDWSRQHDVLQVDHVFPLSLAWRMGASRWPDEERLRFANDPLNLLPVRGEVNEAKGGSGPGGWLPPWQRVRCSYSVRFAQVALKYDLPVTRTAKIAMLRQCWG